MGLRAYRNLSQILTLEGAFQKNGRHLKPNDLGVIENATVVFDQEKILWVGADKNLPEEYQHIPSRDFKGKTLTPELVDSHTHLIFGGNRSHEYTMRLNGATYEEIAQAGGGILNTMNGTNSLTAQQLFDICVERIERLYSYGVGTIEIKSGYGLNLKKELELSTLIDNLKKYFHPRIQIFNTYMAAHAVPKDFQSSADYMDKVVMPLLEKLAPLKIIDAVDIFHEKGYFSTEDVKKLFERAKALGIPCKVHADEFVDNKGAILACEYKALSCDHLLSTAEDGITALSNADTVATLLPGTGFFLGKKQADGKKMLDAGAKVAVASDYNPGSCHCDNLLMVAALAAPQYKMNIAELWAAITLNSAHALGLKKQGAIVPGLAPRFSLFSVEKADMITYSWGRNFAERIS